MSFAMSMPFQLRNAIKSKNSVPLIVKQQHLASSSRLLCTEQKLL